MVTSSGSPPKAAPFALHPAQRLDAVEQPPVRARGAVPGREVGVTEEAEEPEAVVDRDDDHVAAGRERRALVERAGSGSRAEAATVDPDHDRSAGVVGARRPHVEGEALLVLDEVGALELSAARPAVRSDRSQWRRARSPCVTGTGGANRSAVAYGMPRNTAIPSFHVPAHLAVVQVHHRCRVHAIPLVPDRREPTCPEIERIGRYGQDVTAPMPDPAPIVDGRRARRHRSRDLAVDAVLDLLGEGVLRPTAQQVAERSGVSLRSIFRIFDDVESLNAAAAARQLSRIRHLFVDVMPTGTPDGAGRRRWWRSTAGSTSRSHRSAAPRCARHPSRRRCRSSSARARGWVRGEVERVFAPELATAAPRHRPRPSSWRCPSRHGTSCGPRRALSPTRATATVTRIVTALLTAPA